MVQGAAGSLSYPFNVTNHGSGSCPIGGYFGVSIYDQPGDVITASATRDPGSQPQPIELAVGGVANFRVLVGVTPADGNSQTCPVIGSFHLIPPNAAIDVQVSVPASANYRDCGGVYVEATTAVTAS